MNGNILGIFVLCVALSAVFGSPLQQNSLAQPNYNNIPRCFQPAVTGLCLAYFPSYRYNPSTKTCEQFIYGGCGGNQNRFVTFEACMAACEGAEPEEQDFKLIVPTENIDPCSQPKDTGDCRASIPRFYFDLDGGKCESFLYGGCEGNKNNFKSLEDCLDKCGNRTSEKTEEVAPTSESKSEEAHEEQPESEVEKNE